MREFSLSLSWRERLYCRGREGERERETSRPVALVWEGVGSLSLSRRGGEASRRPASARCHAVVLRRRRYVCKYVCIMRGCSSSSGGCLEAPPFFASGWFYLFFFVLLIEGIVCDDC